MDTVAEVVPAVTDGVKVEGKEEEEQQEDQTVKVEEKETEKTDTSTDPLFSYLKRGYTSEIYKIELRNLPKFIDHGVSGKKLYFVYKTHHFFSIAAIPHLPPQAGHQVQQGKGDRAEGFQGREKLARLRFASI